MSPRVSEKENDVDGQKYWQTDSVPSRILSDFKNPCALPRNIKVQAQRLPSVLRRVEEAGQLPPKFIHRGTPGRLIGRAHSSYNYSQFVGAMDPTDGKFPKATEMEDEVDEQDCQTAIVASLSPSAQDLDAESYGVFEATKPDSELKKPSVTPRNIRLQRHEQPSGCSKQYSSVTTRNKFDGVPLRKCLTSSAKDIQIAGATKKVAYATTLGGGGGYGDPHPPPFYKCKVCRNRTAFSRLKCCHLLVCDHCGCDCDTEYVEDKKLQFQKDGQQSNKEKLPKVRLQASNNANVVWFKAFL
ncbi:hypothetical protein PR202_gb09080 [Eleusine coracana subsp. coracana]|uniref:Uncharacterized protein n=1 Tax=Eleusine coracana subsp. coracana TaxID=191504 RepID=A0AAV5EG15_ELECO|nr:hypothetical protein PR202_gb09080 [Eleusine coracana subsp. coracana]